MREEEKEKMEEEEEEEEGILFTSVLHAYMESHKRKAKNRIVPLFQSVFPFSM